MTKNEPTTLDLSAYTDPESRRYTLARPWLDGEYVYATDGRGLVRVERRLFPAAEPPEGRVPKADDILGLLDDVKEWQPCPPLIECEACNNTGRIEGECENCGGDGHCVCECEHEHDCGWCDGSGTHLFGFCDACKVRVGGKGFQRRYFAPVIDMPGFEVALCATDNDKLFFRFDGGVGAVMAVED